jgi:hypothetical protein
MQWNRLFLLLLLAPTFIFASFDQEDCRKVVGKIEKERARHYDYIQQFTNLKPHEQEEGVNLLRQAIACCEKGISLCDKVLAKIAKKPKSDRNDPWWVHTRKLCEDRKLLFAGEIASLQAAITTTLQNYRMDKAIYFYEESERKSLQAKARAGQLSTPSQHNIDLVMSVTEDVTRLYEEALASAKKSLEALLSCPMPDEQSKDHLVKTIEYLQYSIDECKEFATQLRAQPLLPMKG